MKKLLLVLAAVTLTQNLFAEDVGVAASVALSPAGSFVGRTADVKGSATVTNGTVSAKDIKINLTTIKTGIDLRDKHTQKHMETDKFPEAILVSATGKDGKGQAKINFHGVEKDVQGTYTLAGDKLTANFPIKLKDFGITGIKYMGVGVKDEVKIQVTVPVTKAVK